MYPCPVRSRYRCALSILCENPVTRVCPDRHSWRHPSLKSLCSRLVLLRFTLLSDRSVRAGKSRALCRVGVLVRQWCDFFKCIRVPFVLVIGAH